MGVKDVLYSPDDEARFHEVVQQLRRARRGDNGARTASENVERGVGVFLAKKVGLQSGLDDVEGASDDSATHSAEPAKTVSEYTITLTRTDPPATRCSHGLGLLAGEAVAAIGRAA